MINGLGVLGWGVGGIEAEAAMLGQPVSMLIPQVVGFRLHGKLPEGATATDLVLTVTQMLRKKGVVGKFVEFYGEGLADLPLADRATIANMAPEYGATCGIFPVDAETLRYLRATGRPESLVRLVEAYNKEQGLFHDAKAPAADYSDTLELDLASVEPCLAGPSRPQDRVRLADVKKSFAEALPKLQSAAKPKAVPLPTAPASGALKEIAEGGPVGVPANGLPHEEVSAQDAKNLRHGSVVIAAITSCTNTSNPSVMLAAGLVAQNAAAKGLHGQAVGQDEPGAGVEGRHRLPDRIRTAEVAGANALQPRRLRLHHLHRQLRPAARSRVEADQGRQPGRGGGAERQPQLRGARPRRGAGQLPRLAAAGRRLCLGRPRRFRLADGAARQ